VALYELSARCTVRVTADAQERPSEADAKALIAEMVRAGVEEYLGTANEVSVSSVSIEPVGDAPGG
jgi:hypothetical protein